VGPGCWAAGLLGKGTGSGLTALDLIAARIRACRICVVAPAGKPLPHEPRPVLQESSTATILIAGQAPGKRVHASGKPFTDPSGDRLRSWMGIRPDVFYDASRIAIAPMGFCFPGLDAKGGDLPPRKECAPAWRSELLGAMPQIKLVLVIGQYAQGWHFQDRKLLAERVKSWRNFAGWQPVMFPLPHPSWRNTGWLKKNPWFEAELVPDLQGQVRSWLNAG
jgi:uracil-DNA glycosylase